MPKDEIDADDPLELVGVGLPADENTDMEMTDTLIEEYMRAGFNADRVLNLFRQPFYAGSHRVWRARGDEYIRGRITEIFRAWGRAASFVDTPHPNLPPQGGKGIFGETFSQGGKEVFGKTFSQEEKEVREEVFSKEEGNDFLPLDGGGARWGCQRAQKDSAESPAHNPRGQS